MILRIQFSVPKRRVFKGWVAKITDWPEGKRPELAFGKWNSTTGCAEISGMTPGEIFMYGANSPGMRSLDKTTKFGRVGLTDDGQLRCLELSRDDGDAQEHWETGYSVDLAGLDAKLALLSSLTPDGWVKSVEKLLAILNEVAEICLIPKLRHVDPSSSPITTAEEWLQRSSALCLSQPHLAPIMCAVASFVDQWKAERPKRKKQREQTNLMVEA